MVRIAFCTALTVILLLSARIAPCAETLRLTASPWPPYVTENAPRSGVATALVARALERAGYDTQFRLAPWPDALQATALGEADVYVALWSTDEREQRLAFSEPYLTNDLILVRRTDRNDIRFRNREDLASLRIGVVDDFAYLQAPADTTDIDITSAGSVRENLARLRGGEIDLVLADRRVALYEINERSLAKQFRVLPQPVASRGLRIAIARANADHEAIITAFERAIAEMRADGDFSAVLASFRVSE